MKIAVTYNNEEVFQHFGHTEQFKIYDVENKKIINTQIINTQGSGHGVLGGLLAKLKVNVLICGGIGAGARNVLKENNIEVLPGVEGNADEAIEKYINGTLEYDLNKQCDHHEHSHEHDCGTYNCSADKGGCTGNK